MPVRYSAIIPVLLVAQVQPTRSFFVDRLGFAVSADVQFEGHLGSSVVHRDDVRLKIQAEAVFRADTGERSVPGPYTALTYVEIDDIGVLVPEIIDADIVIPLRRTANGMHEIGVREPGGNILMFASPLRA